MVIGRPVKAAIPYGMILYAFVVFLVIAITKTQEQDSFYFDPSPISQDVTEGDEVRLRCDVSNRKMIVFYWTMNGKTIANTSRQYQEDSDLKILRVDRNLDFGSFRCVATNVSTGIALRSTEAWLNILWLDTVASVQLVKPLTVADIVEGSELTLKCQVEGNPEATIEWFRNRLRLLPSDRIRFNKNRIKMSGATAADNGVYSCKARNSANSIDSSDFFLLNIAGVGAPRLKADTFSSVLLAKPNSQAVFNCEYSGAASTEWYNSNNSLIMNDTGLDRRHSVLKNGSLVIKQVEASDAGVYHCVGINDKGPAQTFAAELSLSYLNDLSDSSFEPKPESPQVIPINGKFDIRCISSKGLPNPSLRWVGPYDTALPTQGRIKAVESVLTITAAEETDSGNYTCIVENLSGKKWKSIWISVSVAPKISRPPLSVRVTEGESAIFDCRVTGSPYPVTNILWKKDDDILDVQNSKIVLSKMGETLTINDVSPLDEGNYACLVNTTGHPTVLSTYAHLYVEKQLKFRPIPVNAKLELGSNSTLRCNAEGRFVPRIRWTKNGSPQLPENVRINDGTMYFIGVRYNDAGSYTCTATNEQGSINVTVRVDIVVKPKFKVKPLNTTTHEGSSVMLHCVASGEPAPAIHWDKNNKVEAFDQSRIKILPNGSLHITQVYMEDVGKYGCTAGNSGGFEREEIFLHVTSGSQFTSMDIRAAAENFNMMKTIIIAVCSAVAYLAIVIGLTVYCSIRLVRAKNLRKHCRNESTDKENCATAPNEMTELMESSVIRGAMSVKSDADVQSLSTVGSYNSHLNSQHSMQRGTSGLEYFRNNLQSIGMLGKGQYGDVFLAKAMNICATEPETIVVVKSLLSHADQHQAEFVREMGMYARLDHEHVSKLLGICRDKEPMFLLYEYCEWGDLKQFLIAVKKDLGKPSSRILQLNTTQKIAMCAQVASGLEYIANNRFVHKDIAARNILLTPTLNVKVANLSLCHDIYSGEYFHYRQQLIPLRWMPPEAVFNGDFSTKSDIWSFGVFLWEVFSFGEIPVRNKSDEEVLSDLNLGGTCLLDCPPGCPVDVWKMINRCTLINPRERPTFSELIIGFGELTADSEL